MHLHREFIETLRFMLIMLSRSFYFDKRSKFDRRKKNEAEIYSSLQIQFSLQIQIHVNVTVLLALRQYLLAISNERSIKILKQTLVCNESKETFNCIIVIDSFKLGKWESQM